MKLIIFLKFHLDIRAIINLTQIIVRRYINENLGSLSIERFKQIFPNNARSKKKNKILIIILR